jgi:alpha-L-fucosidase 2
MLLHSHNPSTGSGQAYEIKLLPALPDQWPDGHVKGLRARGDCTVDIYWKDGQLTEAKVHAGPRAPGSAQVVYNGKAATLQIRPNTTATITKDSFQTH